MFTFLKAEHHNYENLTLTFVDDRIADITVVFTYQTPYDTNTTAYIEHTLNRILKDSQVKASLLHIANLYIGVCITRLSEGDYDIATKPFPKHIFLKELGD